MNILLTGVSRGVGLEICRVLLNNGHNVFGIARSHTQSFKDLQSEYPETLFFKSVDLLDVNNLYQVVFKDYIGNKTPIDGLVNNAGVAYDDIVSNINLNKLESLFAVNVYTPMILTKYVIRNMILHKRKGSLVHISSISAHTAYKGLSMYASSKGALEAFSKGVAREWGELGIRSNVVVPGFMETSMSSTLTENQKDRIYKRTALKVPTEVSSVAETVDFLLSKKSISITGQNIFVDSGTI
jgi:3-oxoacyl-[acyl-carrier protein] reductase